MSIRPLASVEYGSIDRGGRQLRWKRAGSGPPVVLEIGAGAGGVDYWGPLETQLATTNTVITYDRAGMGGSDRIPGGPTLSSWTSDLRAVVDAVAGGPATLVGWSLGGVIALGFALEHPALTAGAVFVDPSEDRHGPLQIAIYKYLHPLIMPAVTRLHSYRTRNETGIAKARRRAIRQVDKIAPALSDEEKARVVDYLADGTPYRAMAYEVPALTGAVADLNRLRDRTGTPDLPVVVLSATEGPLRKSISASHQRLAATFPRGKFTSAEGCTHMIPLERPDLIAAAVRNLARAAGGD